MKCSYQDRLIIPCIIYAPTTIIRELIHAMITTTVNGYKISRVNRNAITSFGRVFSRCARSIAPTMITKMYSNTMAIIEMIEIMFAILKIIVVSFSNRNCNSRIVLRRLRVMIAKKERLLLYRR